MTNYKLSIEGLRLCMKNAERLFDDGCAEGLSLPTRAALFEIGLEEFAKGFMIFYCVEKGKKLFSPRPEEINIKEIPQEIESTLANFLSKLDFDCDKDIDKAFKLHEMKTDIVKAFASIFEPRLAEVDQLYSSVEILLKEFTGQYIPPGKLQESLSDPTIKTNIPRKMGDIKNLEKTFNSKIKENGFYVNYEQSQYRYPTANEDQVIQLAELLSSLLFTVNKLIKSANVIFNRNNYYLKLQALKRSLKK